MLRELIKLADHLDRHQKRKQANIVDTLVSKIASELTWSGDPNATPILSPEYRTFQRPRSRNHTVPLTEDTSLDLEAHPLGQVVADFVEKALRSSDSESEEGEERISVKDIERVIQAVIRYDENLNYYENYQENPEAISPLQFREIVERAISFVNERYYSSGIINRENFQTFITALIKNYEDFYLYQYSGMPEKLPFNPKVDEALKPGQSQFDMSGFEMSEEDKDKLYEENQRRLLGPSEDF